jgi:hypothetical protein
MTGLLNDCLWVLRGDWGTPFERPGQSGADRVQIRAGGTSYRMGRPIHAFLCSQETWDAHRTRRAHPTPSHQLLTNVALATPPVTFFRPGLKFWPPTMPAAPGSETALSLRREGLHLGTKRWTAPRPSCYAVWVHRSSRPAHATSIPRGIGIRHSDCAGLGQEGERPLPGLLSACDRVSPQRHLVASHQASGGQLRWPAGREKRKTERCQCQC